MKFARLLRSLLTIIGALTLLKYGAIKLLSMNPDPDDEVMKTAYLSPSGSYNATRVTRSGGGAIAPFCSDEVFVFNQALTIDDVLTHPDYRVYSAACDVFSSHENSPKIKWTSDSDLQIDFSIRSTSIASTDVTLKGSDASEKIKISYSAYR